MVRPRPISMGASWSSRPSPCSVRLPAAAHAAARLCGSRSRSAARQSWLPRPAAGGRGWAIADLRDRVGNVRDLRLRSLWTWMLGSGRTTARRCRRLNSSMDLGVSKSRLIAPSRTSSSPRRRARRPLLQIRPFTYPERGACSERVVRTNRATDGGRAYRRQVFRSAAYRAAASSNNPGVDLPAVRRCHPVHLGSPCLWRS